MQQVYRSPKPKKSAIGRGLRFAVGGCFLILVLVAGGAFIGVNWFNSQIYEPASTSEEVKYVTADKGETFAQYLNKLQQNGLVKNVDAARVYIKVTNHEPSLQEGKYGFPANSNFPAILEIVEKGPLKNSFRVVLPEGYRIDENAATIAKAVKDSGVEDPRFVEAEYLDIAMFPDKYDFNTEVQQFLDLQKPGGKSLEGFLFPDTYVLGADATALQIINLQIQTLITRLAENELTASGGKLRNFYEVLNVASIVHREAIRNEDKKLVADIFIRRVKEGWTLGSDVTILYPYKRWSPEPTAVELQTYTPYNTRLIQGLPPTPIANSGIEDIAAVLNPTPNNYYYFISVGADMYYARTLQEHNVNVNRYLR